MGQTCNFDRSGHCIYRRTIWETRLGWGNPLESCRVVQSMVIKPKWQEKQRYKVQKHMKHKITKTWWFIDYGEKGSSQWQVMADSLGHILDGDMISWDGELTRCTQLLEVEMNLNWDVARVRCRGPSKLWAVVSKHTSLGSSLIRFPVVG